MFDPFVSSSIGRDTLAAVLGLCVGSFLNVLALRSLAEESLLWPPSHCPKCDRRIAIYDLIPVLSYLLLNGKCRNCHQPIHWAYPFVEVFTACTFVILLHLYGPNFQTEPTFMDFGKLIGMAIFCSTLIAVCITDFREKLIPHEITYPAILLGITYSGIVRNDFQGAMVGIGVSYILFDFVAFYGTMGYVMIHGDPSDPEVKKKKRLLDPELDSHTVLGHDPEVHIHHTLYSAPHAGEEEEDEDDDEFTVMGGGDAVLSAVIAAWLGLQALEIALIVGFIAGAFVGLTYLIVEMVKTDQLKKCIKPMLTYMLIVLVPVEAGMLILEKCLAQNFTVQLPYFQLGIAAAICGAILGILRSGHDVSKPFPFGPPLAFGAVVAMLTKSMIFPGAP